MNLALKATLSILVATAGVGKAMFTLSKANTVYQSKKLKALRAKKEEMQGAVK